jgi:hypothetical protein
MGENLNIEGGLLAVWTSIQTFVSPTQGAEMRLSDLVGHYRVRSDQGRLANLTAIHIESINSPGNGPAELSFSSNGYARTVAIHLGLIKGVIVALAQNGTFAAALDRKQLWETNREGFMIAGDVSCIQDVALCHDPNPRNGMRRSTQTAVRTSVIPVAVVTAGVIVVVAVRKRRHDAKRIEEHGSAMLKSASVVGSPVGLYTPAPAIA